MKTETLLKTALFVLVVALTASVASWVSSEFVAVRAEGGGGSAAGDWIMVASQLTGGDGLIYMFNAQKEVLLVYSFYRRQGAAGGATRFSGDLEFLAGRHCKWDMLYSQARPYPYAIGGGKSVPSGVHMPLQMQKLYEDVNKP